MLVLLSGAKIVTDTIVTKVALASTATATAHTTKTRARTIRTKVPPIRNRVTRTAPLVIKTVPSEARKRVLATTKTGGIRISGTTARAQATSGIGQGITSTSREMTNWVLARRRPDQVKT